MAEGWPAILDAAVDLRRDLHRRPELTWAEHATARTIRGQLDAAGIPWRACADTGTVATLAPDAQGPHLALRADIDAMPVRETTGIDWVSGSDGVMHACGHDGHTASLFAAAWWLRANEGALPGPVTLVFQPAEEGGHGAKRMIDEGALDDVVRPGGVARDPASSAARPVEFIYGWHNWPAIPYGQAACPDGAVMSANGSFSIEVCGEGGHSSQPEATRDPVLAASAITLGLQQIVARRLPPHQAAVVAVTSIEAPSGLTVTPGQATLAGTIRVGDTAQRDAVFELIASISADIARGYGVEAVTTPAPRYGATVNDPSSAARMREALSVELGGGWHSSAALPVMASEDFSYYLARVPGAFALVGADDGRGHDHPCHSPRYDFNDLLIPSAARVLARLAGVPVPADAGGDVAPVTIPDIEHQ